MRVALGVDWFLQYGVHLANGLQSAGCEVLFLCRDHAAEIAPGCAEPEAAVRTYLARHLQPGIKLHLLCGRHRDLPRSLRELAEAYAALRRHRTEIIHYQANADWRLFALSRLIQRPLVYTLHDVVPHPGQHAGATVSVLERLYRRKAAALIVHGDALKRQVREVFGSRVAQRVCSIPHGALGLTESGFCGPVPPIRPRNVLFFGRMTKYKGLDVLAAAMRQLAERHVQIELTLAGTGPESIEAAFGAAAAAPNIEVIERYVPDDELRVLLRQTAAVVVPYTEGSQSGVIAQAYAFGKPVVATDVGAFGEVVQHERTGLLIPPNDPQALAAALERLVDDDDLRARLEKGVQALVKDTLSWDAIGRKTRELYSRCLVRR